MLISVDETGNSQQEPGQESVGDAAVLSHCSMAKTDWCAGALFCPFPSHCIPKVTKDVNVQKFPSYRNSCKLYQQIPGTF